MIGASLSVTNLQRTALADVLARFPGVATYHDFANNRYYGEGQTRSAAAELVDALPDNGPTGSGFEIYGASTNLYADSNVSGASWILTASGGSITVTPGFDDGAGGTSACRVQIDATPGGSFPRLTAITSSVSTVMNSTVSFRVKSFDGSPQNIALYGTRAGISEHAVTADWSTISYAQTAATSTVQPGFGLREGHTTALVCDVLVAFAMVENGDVAGPAIVTNGAPVTRPAAAPTLVQGTAFGENLYTGQTWNVISGVTQTASHISYDGTQDDASLAVRIFGLPTVEGDVVEISYALENYVQGDISLSVSLNPTPAVTLTSSNGLVSQEITVGPSQPDRLLFNSYNGFIGDILLSSIAVRIKRALPFQGASVADELGPELWSFPDVAVIADWSGSAGAYDSATHIMSNTNTGPGGYPRFQFDLGLVVDGRYKVEGRLSGDIGAIGGIRLAVMGSNNPVSYNPATGVFSAEQVAGSAHLEFFGDGSLFSTAIEELSIRRVTNDKQITFAVQIDNVSTEIGANKTILQFHDAATHGVNGNNRALLYFENTISNLNLGVADGAGAWQGGPGAGAGFNDGGPHSVVGFVDLDTKTLKLSVDGGAAVTSVEPTFPTELGIIEVGHYNNGSPTAQLNGEVSELALANGDYFSQWAGL
jgi:hypothetical protein